MCTLTLAWIVQLRTTVRIFGSERSWGHVRGVCVCVCARARVRVRACVCALRFMNNTHLNLPDDRHAARLAATRQDHGQLYIAVPRRRRRRRREPVLDPHHPKRHSRRTRPVRGATEPALLQKPAYDLAWPRQAWAGD